jgi:hypothetical protein
MALFRKFADVCLVLACISIGVGAACGVGIVALSIGFVSATLAVAIGTGIDRSRKRAGEEPAAFEPPHRIAHRADYTAESAENTDTTTANVGCPNCQHVQTVPAGQQTFACEQCRHT